MKLRFTIRDLFWLTLVAALGFGWWFDHQRTNQINRLTVHTTGPGGVPILLWDNGGGEFLVGDKDNKWYPATMTPSAPLPPNNTSAKAP
jgi:hypothetical protein